MTTETIEQRLRDIKNELHLLDGLREESDDINIHIIEEHVILLQNERVNLKELLENSFDKMIGL
jgi:hypothetical protein